MIIDVQPGDIRDERARRKAWLDAISPVFHGSIDDAVTVPPTVLMKNYNLQRCLFGVLRAPRQRIERTPSQISTQAVDHLLVRIYLAGTASVNVGAESRAVSPGDFTVFDLSQVMVSDTGEISSINLLMPRRSLDRRLGDLSPLHGRVFRQTLNPFTQLMADHLRSLAQCVEAADEWQRDSLSVATVALCNAMLTPEAGGTPYSPDTVLGIAVRQFIDADLTAYDLDADKLTARFGISRTNLYALFEPDGGVATYIRHRRLARAMRILAGVEGGPLQRIATVGYACGFETEKGFSRAFRRRYGINPSEVDGSYGMQAHFEHGATLMSWMKDL